MLNSFFILLIFLFFVFTEQYVLAGFGGVVSIFPLCFLVGIILAHKTDIWFGAVWFLALGIFALLHPLSAYHAVSYFTIAIVLAPAMSRLFSNRSIYGLVGTGTALYPLFTFVDFFAKRFSIGTDPNYFFQHLPIFLFLPPAFFLSFLLYQFIAGRFSAFFYLRM